MRPSRAVLAVLAAVAMCAAGTRAGAQAPQGGGVLIPFGNIIELRPPLGEDLTRASHMNDRGDVVGRSQGPGGGRLPVVWWNRNNGLPSQLLLPGIESGRAQAIDDLGRVGGRVTNTDTDVTLPALWVQNKVLLLPRLPGGPFGTVVELNQAGVALLELTSSGDQGFGAIWAGSNKLQVLPNLTGATGVNPTSINLGRQVGGTSFTGDVATPVMWQNGRIFVLPQFPGPEEAEVADLNNGGILVGHTHDVDDFDEHAVRWLGRRSIQRLPEPPGTLESHALAINNRGQVVGEVLLDTFEVFPVIWANGQVFNMMEFVDPALGWSELTPVAINNNGQIAGTGLLNGVERAFRLTLPRNAFNLAAGVL